MEELLEVGVWKGGVLGVNIGDGDGVAWNVSGESGFISFKIISDFGE